MQSIFKDLADSLSAFGEAFRLIARLGLWYYVILPGLISLLFGGLVIFAAISAGGIVSSHMENWYPWDWGAGFVESFSGILSGIIIVALAIIIYKYVILIIVAPFMSPLSEKVERHLRGGRISGRFSFRQIIHDLVRGIRIGIRNIVRELFFTFIIFLVGLFPLIAWLSPIIIFIIQAYYAGFGNMDYTLERHFGVKGSARFVRRNRGLAIGNGAVFILLLTIPVVGLFIAPSLCTIAATIESVKRIAPDETDRLELV